MGSLSFATFDNFDNFDILENLETVGGFPQEQKKALNLSPMRTTHSNPLNLYDKTINQAWDDFNNQLRLLRYIQQVNYFSRIQSQTVHLPVQTNSSKKRV